MTPFLAALLQGWITASACGAIWLLARNDAARRWGFVVGLAGQPAWLYETFSSGQFGMLLVTGFFTWVYARGCWEYFVRPPLVEWKGR